MLCYPSEYVSSIDWVLKADWRQGYVRGYYPARVPNTRSMTQANKKILTHFMLAGGTHRPKWAPQLGNI